MKVRPRQRHGVDQRRGGHAQSRRRTNHLSGLPDAGRTVPRSSRALERERQQDLAIETIAEGKYIGGIDLRGINGSIGKLKSESSSAINRIGAEAMATDAMRVIMRLGFDKMGLKRLWLKVLAFNARGIRCYAKCGFKREGLLRADRFIEGKFHDGVIMAILEEEYQTAAKSW